MLRPTRRGGESVPQGTTVTVSFSDGPEKIPDVVGMQQKDAEKAIRDAGFEPDVLEVLDTTKPEGTVIQQSPQAGQTADQGSTVTILVSPYQAPTESPSPTESPTGRRRSRPCRRRPSRSACPGTRAGVSRAVPARSARAAWRS